MGDGGSSSGWAPVGRIDAPAVARAVVAAGGPELGLVSRLAGGEVGAWLVAWPDDHRGVMTWHPRPPEGHPGLDAVRVQQLMAVAADAGTPVARWERVVELGGLGWAVLQHLAPGVPVGEPSGALVDSMVDLALARRGLLDEPGAMSLFLSGDGPSFCLHGPLEAAGGEAQQLLEAVRRVGAELGDELVGTDVVHTDWHVGNVLVEPHQPARVTAVVDWGSVRAGLVELDLATLAFDCSWRAPAVAERAETALLAFADEDTLRLAWAHMALRLVDWAIRHHPADIHHWVTVGRRHL